MKCILCNTENDDDNSNCVKCGAKLNDSSVSDKLKNIKPIGKQKTENENSENHEADELEPLDETINVGKIIAKNTEKQNAISSETEKNSDLKKVKDVLGVDELKKAIRHGDEKKSAEKKTNSADKVNGTKKINKKNSGNNFNLNTMIKLGICVACIVLALVVASFFTNNNDKKNPVVVFESLGVLYANDPIKNKTTEIYRGADDFDVNLLKSSNENEVFYYPKNFEYTNNGFAKFELYKNENEVEEIVLDSVYEDYFVSSDGTKVLYPNSVTNLYGETVCELYLYDYTTRISIDDNVILSSITIADDSKSVMYLKGDNSELYSYNFKKHNSQKIEDEIDKVLYVSDDLNNVYFTKMGKKIDESQTVNLYRAKNQKKANKIATNVIENTIVINDSDIVCLKYPSEHPEFSVYSQGIVDVSNKDMKEYKNQFDEFCSNNFYDLIRIDFDGKQEKTIGSNVHMLNYVSKGGENVVFTSLKNEGEISSDNVTEFNDLIKAKNLDSFVLDKDGNILKIHRVEDDVYLGNISDEFSFDYDAKNNELYYIDAGETIKAKYNAGNLQYEKVDINSKYINFEKNDLLILNNDNQLLKVDKKLEKEVVDDNVVPESIYFDENNLFYQKLGENNKTDLFNGNNKKEKLISEGITDKNILVLGDVMYYKNEEGLMIYNKNKSKLVDKNANNLNVLY